MDLSARIKMARERAGITQRELARLMNVTRSACSQWENRRIGGPQFGRLWPLAEILGVNYQWLATGIGQMENTSGRLAEPGHDYLDGLSAEEKRLLQFFRALSRRRQLALLEFLEDKKVRGANRQQTGEPK